MFSEAVFSRVSLFFNPSNSVFFNNYIKMSSNLLQSLKKNIKTTLLATVKLTGGAS